MFKETPTTIDELRLLMRVKLTIAPRPMIQQLIAPGIHETRERARHALIEHLTCGVDRWRFIKVVEDRVWYPHRD